ncbi:MAG: tRNA pseudouridine(55) synthase TruB, partial [Solirubrobacteraceae bacterium]
AYSAVKVGGRRAYELARAGEEVELAERAIEVYRFEQLWQREDRRAFVIECSSGTYVRSLIADLGDAYCESLRRTAIGSFDVAAADPGRPIALNEALAFLPEVRLEGEDARRAGHGSGVVAPESPAPESPAGTVRLTDEEGLIALAEPEGDALRPVVGFRG